jgi:mannobiose 2-epimerase
MTISPELRLEFKQRIENEILNNVLPFWIRHAPDREHGGFYGLITNDLRVYNDVPRSSVLCSRILWTFSAAYRLYGGEAYLDMATMAFDELLRHFWDREYSGVFWAVDYQGNIVSDRKQIYAQAFALYGLAEYYRATRNEASLEHAVELFHCIETYSHDRVNGGYFEARDRRWQPSEDVRLSDKDLNALKSMNTMLHVMEAYTSLLRVWDNGDLRHGLKELVEVMLERVLTAVPYDHFALFFDEHWKPLSDRISFGHDIEGSWLLTGAAEVLGDPALLARVQMAALRLAQAVYEHGLDTDGSLFYEADPAGIVNADKHWWPQAEAVVGFYNAFQLSLQEHFFDASYRCWDYIERRVIDRAYGEWFYKLTREGRPYPDYPADPDQYKIGPWKCPYHNGRAGFEMARRLSL